ncbi:MAG TPA: SDR family NAD(P)-dependent oxidoreductase [Bavariicoccus seileri]|uniref:SDR family NAD(P)-dependent oxidoreductase n=1 Tax=Bavariicoccus seileri TaxID=549685 RepID=A0A3D4S3N6_9ENTE|nr:SDR family oxidoreductase [Bavariicoccus seileri]HCS93188.1 SDR family NAD(P)-dependent oxidoreductase [Bavariicoccus seileri]
MEKHALIIGASGVIGGAIAKDLAQVGWSLTLHANDNIKQVTSLRQSLQEKFPNQFFSIIQFDLSNIDKSILSNILPISGLVFASGGTVYDFLRNQTTTDINHLFKVHVFGPIEVIQFFEAQLLKAKHARIVFITSVYASHGSALETTYSAVKGAQESFIKSYAMEVAANDLTVNGVAPGAVKTPTNYFLDQSAWQQLIEEIPLQRLADPEDISYWVSAIFDKRSDYLTGQVIKVTGGWGD